MALLTTPKATSTNKLWSTAAACCAAALRDDASFYVTAPQAISFIQRAQALIDGGLPVRHILIWNKQQFVFGRSDYHYKHEPILYGWINTHTYRGKTNDTSVWDIDRPRTSKLHPTMKPTGLYEKAILNSSEAGDLILDPFAGSGTAIIAAETTGRIAHAIELEPFYIDVICTRYQQFTGTLPTRNGTPHDFTPEES